MEFKLRDSFHFQFGHTNVVQHEISSSIWNAYNKVCVLFDPVNSIANICSVFTFFLFIKLYFRIKRETRNRCLTAATLTV